MGGGNSKGAKTKAKASKYIIFVDQGGGSFAMYLFEKTKDSLKLKQKTKLKEIIDKIQTSEMVSKLKKSTGIEIWNEKKKALNDFSGCPASSFPELISYFAKLYKNAEKVITDSHGIPDSRIIRQTGKIRERLMKEASKVDREAWNAAMKESLGKDWDYQLLANSTEAKLEGRAFFLMNNMQDSLSKFKGKKSEIVGASVGSSSTQAYWMRDESESKQSIVSSYCSSLGALASAKEKALAEEGKPKTAAQFQAQFEALLQPAFEDAKRNTLVILGAYGYINETLCDALGCESLHDEVRQENVVDVEFFHENVKIYRELDDANEWISAFFSGLSRALKNLPNCKYIIGEKKGSLGKSIDIETSWVQSALRYGFA